LIEEAGKYKIYKCPDCGLQFADPIDYNETSYKEEKKKEGWIGNYYADYMAKSASNIETGVSIVIASYMRFAIKWMIKHLPANALVLDVGCGDGSFLASLKRNGFSPVGTEVDPNRVDILKKKGFRVFNSINEYGTQLPVPAVISIFEVLEHLPDPLGFLKQVRSIFPESTIILSVPSPKRWGLFTGKTEYWDYPPNHYTRWSEKTLSIVFDKAGYSAETCYPLTVPEEINGDGLVEILLSFFKSKNKIAFSSGINFQDPVKQKRSKYIKKVAFWPFAFILNILGYRCSSMVTIAKPFKRREIVKE